MNGFIARWWRPLLFFAWISALMGLLENGRYTAFLRPEFRYLLVLGGLIMWGFFIAGIGQRSSRLSISQVVYGFILFLPLAYLWNAQGASLDTYALQRRWLGHPGVKTAYDAWGTQCPSASTSSTDEPTEKDQMATGKSETRLTAASAQSVTILDLYYSPKIYEGKRVKLIGVLHKNDPQVRENFGRVMLVVFRFVVTCCAADASPVAVLVDGENLPPLDENSWVEVDGNFRVMENKDQKVPIVEHSTLRTISAPRQPYLYLSP